MDLVRESGAQVEEVIPSNGGSVGLWPGLGKLIQILSPDEDAHLRTKSRRALEAQRKNSRQKCLEACIKNNRSQLGVAPVTASAPLSPLDQLHTLIYEKRLDGEHQLADLLLTQANLIQNSFSASTLSDFGPVIQLLVLLHNPRGESYHHESSPGSVSKLPPYFPFRSALAKVKEEDFSSRSNFRFATLDHLERNSRTYPHFHPEEFQFPGGSFSSKPTTSSSWTSKDLNPTLFQLEPGTGLTILNQDEKSLRSNLSKPIPSMKIPPLELTLAKPGAGRELRIPRDRSNRHSRISRVISYSSSQPLNHDDEGYSSPEPKSGESLNIWDEVLNGEFPSRRTWESLGKIDPAKSKPYLTELGPQGVHKAWIVAMENLRLVDPRTPIPTLRVVSDAKLVLDIGYLMIGIASETFDFHEASESFSVKPGTCSAGVSPDAFFSFVQDFLVSGNACRRLEKFASGTNASRSINESSQGLVYQGFLTGINKYLQGYRTTVLNIAQNRRLLNLSNALAKLSNQVQFLARLCMLDGDKELASTSSHDEMTPKREFPRGIQLLSYLFDRTMHINTRELYFVLVSILRLSAEPYFRFLESWMFEGFCHDDFREFGLYTNPPFLNIRSRIFWTSAFAITDFQEHDMSICGGGDFISAIQKEVFVCGKSLHLLRLCQPSHHLCAAVVDHQPGIKLLVTPVEQAQLKRECKDYVSFMTKVSEEKSLTLARKKEKEMEAKRNLLVLAHERHKAQLETLKEDRRCRKEEEDRRKRLVFEDLQEQVNAERKRKNEALLQKVAEDKKFAEESERKLAEDLARESAVKKEMESFYKTLADQAELREVRAKWRMRRMELRASRILFWREENKRMSEMRKNVAKNLENDRKSTMKESWKQIRIVEDDQKNVQIVLEDEECNIISENVSNYSEFSSEVQSQMLSDTFTSLPDWVQNKLLDNVPWPSADTTDNGNAEDSDNANLVEKEGSFNRRSGINSSGKRKRPDSFIESAGKRKELDEEEDEEELIKAGKEMEEDIPETFDEDMVFSRPKSAPLHRSRRREEQLKPYESLASVLHKEDRVNANINKSDPYAIAQADIPMAETRKRPTSSKSIEQILYPQRFGIGSRSSEDLGTPMSLKRRDFFSEINGANSTGNDSVKEGGDYSKVLPYTKNFTKDLEASTVENFTARILPRKTGADGEIDPQAFTPLSMLMENSILIPLRAQLQVVQSSLLNYMLVDAGLMDHLKALRNYLLFHDGEFAHHLSTTLFNEINEATVATEILNPATLNRIVENSLMSSTFGNCDPLSGNVGFSVGEFDNHTMDVLGCLRLGYRTDWPSNIILTNEAVAMYGEIFQFLLQLRKAVWAMEQVYIGLKGMHRSAHKSQHFRLIQLMRHEMLNFVTVTQNYVTTQVLDVTWAEFMTELTEKVRSLDGLYDSHMKYLQKAFFRCILNKKAKPVHKTIVDTFSIVAKFSLLLSSRSWEYTEDGEAIHPAMEQMQETYAAFREYSRFLYTVVQKLAIRGYQPHLSDLILCLNYNGYYERKN